MLEIVLLMLAVASCVLILLSFWGLGLVRMRDRGIDHRMAAKLVKRNSPHSRQGGAKH